MTSYVSKESEAMEFTTESEAREWAEENNKVITKLLYCSGSRACLAWMREVINQ